MKWAGLLCLLLSVSASADERILSFDSDVLIRADATIEVTETIRVRAEGRQIRRGIFREIPTEYFDKLGNRFEVSIEPLTVQRDNSRESFHVRRSRESIRVYFGDSDTFLDPGVYEYTFRYRAHRMLGFFAEHDELYWNASGFEWRFPIDTATASVAFDFDVSREDLRVDGYTGAFGDTGKDFRVDYQPGPVVGFTALSPLSPANSLTIAVGWPKGLVEAPSAAQRAGWVVRDNRGVLIALLGLVAMFAFYIPVWMKFGRDPEEGVVFTRYEPPGGYSPASLRYVRQMYYDNRVMSAAIINLAVKGYLSLHESGKTRIVEKETPPANAPDMAAGERELYQALFSEDDRVELKNENHKVLGAARAAHRDSLLKDYKGKYFNTNALMNVPGFLIAVTFTVLTFGLGGEPVPMSILLVIALYLVLVFFALIMKRPTMRGQQLLDEMAGFRDYLEVAEKDELNLRNPPKKTPELFERYLPFALALGVDQAWSERFAAVLASATNPDGSAYHPAWYYGTWNSSTNLASDLSGGFNTALAQSVAAPGSSAGSGGGGFSGGGVGGGGGGGW